MRLALLPFALACGLLWTAALLLMGLLHLRNPGYGGPFLELVASFYPGYKASGSFGDLLVGCGYALVDATVAGLVFAWLYNLLLKLTQRKPA